MTKRFLLIAVATAAALALFVATLFMGTPEEAGPDRAVREDGPVDVAPYVDPDGPADGDMVGPGLLQEMSRGHYRFSEGRRDTLLFYDRITPQPHGVMDVEQPIAQVYFSAARVLEIRADACTFLAPDNQPRGGDFRGNVVVTLFETEDGSPVAFDNPDHVQLRTHLDEVSYDLDLGQLESEGPVQLTGRQVEFRGRGLSLIYNELRRRIERLEITEGELLRFTPRRQVSAVSADDASEAGPVVDGRRDGTSAADPAADGDTVAGAEGEAHAGGEGDAGGDDVGQGAGSAAVARAGADDPSADMDPDVAQADEERGEAAAEAPGDEAEAVPFYRAQFERDVQVEAEDGSVRFAADVLVAVFALRSSDWDTASGNRDAASSVAPPAVPYAAAPTRHAVASADPASVFRPAPRLTAAPAGRTSPPVPGAPEDQPAPAEQPVAHEPVAPGDAAGEVVIRWRGPMVLEPELEPSDELVHPEDALLRLVGAPAGLETDADQHLVADEIEYATRTGRVRAIGTADRPIELRSAELGELHALALELNPRAGTGIVTGPGWLASTQTARQATTETEAGADADVGAEADPPAQADAAPADDADLPIRVAWRDRLDLRFYPPADEGSGSPAAGAAPGEQVGGLEVARFHGDVRVTDADFDLEAGQLALHLAPPIDNRQGVRTIEASDGVVFATRTLDLDVAPAPAADPDPDAAEPARPGEAGDDPAADGEAVGNDADTPAPAPGSLRAGALTIDFDVDDAGRSQARRLTARDDVLAEHPEWRLAADRVEAELNDQAVDAAAAAEAAQAFAGRADVRRLTAEGDVSFTLREDRTELASHRMVVDVLSDQLELFGGEADAPARIIRPDATLAGPHLVLAQLDRSVHVIGPGWLDANLDPDDPDARLMVTWQTSMHYDDAAGMAHLVGEVTSRSDTPASRTRLAAGDLRFELAAMDADAAGRGEGPRGAGSAPDDADAADADADARPDADADEDAPATADPDADVEAPAHVEANAEADADSQVAAEAHAAGDGDPTLDAAIANAPAGADATADADPDADRANRASSDATPADAGGDEPVADTPLDDAFGRRQVRFATARDDVVFEAESLDPDTGERLTSIEITGPLVSFNGRDEQVQVIGEGRMVIIDRRPAEGPAGEPAPDAAAHADPAADAADEAAQEPEPDPAAAASAEQAIMSGVGFSGRGMTVFFWQRQLTLDAARNSILFEQGVQMLHQPAQRTDVLHLNAQRLLADMTETGGLANWTAGDAPDPDVQLIRADDNVSILHEGRTIRTDHLQYTADDAIVRLWGEPGRLVSVSHEDQPSDLSAESLWWHLDTGRFEARRPGAGIVPLPGERNDE